MEDESTIFDRTFQRAGISLALNREDIAAIPIEGLNCRLLYDFEVDSDTGEWLFIPTNIDPEQLEPFADHLQEIANTATDLPADIRQKLQKCATAVRSAME